MGVTKSDLFSTDQNTIALIAKALGHPARIAIVQHLIKTNACINSDLVAELGLAQATISQHLRELKKVGIIRGTIEGTSVNYCIDPENFERAKQAFEQLFDLGAISCYHNRCC